MDCMDCHNRPAHKFSAPNDAIDKAMAQGRIDPSMPWVKNNAVEALMERVQPRMAAFFAERAKRDPA